jgi:succinate dehydrogenase / fumarate reductase, iron-sulfur subunit
MKLTLRIWRQRGPQDVGGFETHEVHDVHADESFLEMLDRLNERLVAQGKEPFAFESDCREGICGACSLVIDGLAHGGRRATTTCQLFMRHFRDGQTVHVEPWRAKAFPVLKDSVVDRSAFDRIQRAGGFISVNTGNAPDAHSLPVGKDVADAAMDAAQCIGCGACVAACKNASAMLFVAAKVGHLSLLPQGQPEREKRALAMVEAHDAEGFGACTNYSECEAVCPKEIKVSWISRLNREYLRASVKSPV